jgi:hypothetical protein
MIDLSRREAVRLLAAGAAATGAFPSAAIGNTDIIEQRLSSLQRTETAGGLPALGANVHQRRAAGGPTPDATNVSLLQTIGAQMARIDMVNWDAIEVTKGVYNFSGSIGLVSALRSAGIKIQLVLGYNNRLYAPSWNSGVATQANIDGYVKYCQAVASQYFGPDVIYELRNEVNLNQWWAPTNNPEQYGRMMTQAAAGIKSAKPDAVVLTAGFSSFGGPRLWGPFLDGVMAHGSLANIDGFAFHPYNQGDLVMQFPEWAVMDLSEALQHIGNSKPLYVNEWGYPYSWASNSLMRQATLDARAALTSICIGAKVHLHYDLVDDGLDYTHPEETYGLFDNRFAIKPSGTAFKAITTALAGCTRFAMSFDRPQRLIALTIDKPSGRVVIAWTYVRAAAGTLVTFKSSVGAHGSSTLKDVFGNAKPYTYSDGVFLASFTEADGPLILSLS